MSNRKKHFLRIILSLSFFLLVPLTASGASLENVAVTDLTDRDKTSFSGGDTIRYRLNFTVAAFSIIWVKGTVRFADLAAEKLGLQYETLGSGAHSIYWDSTVPGGTRGNAELTVTVISIPGGLARTSATFSVTPAGSDTPTVDADYVGTSACIGCHAGMHSDIVKAYQSSGMAFALQGVGAAGPEYPDFTAGVPAPPAGFEWDDIAFVIGGFAWKANFVNNAGFVITTGVDLTDAQYNLSGNFSGTPDEFVPYKPDQGEPQAFECAACHTTGYAVEQSPEDNASTVATWNEAGVGCEACHGPGSEHRKNPGSGPPPLDPKRSCGICHIRDDASTIEADAGLILHNQQYEELLSGGKSFLTCTSCHNPHASAHYDAEAPGQAIIQDCTSCHSDMSVSLGMQDLACNDCHMPYAVLSGTRLDYRDPDGNNLSLGDMRSHIFRINTDAAGPSDMFSADGARLALGSDGKAAGLTLDFVCLQCHRENGRANNAYSYDQVKNYAGMVH